MKNKILISKLKDYAELAMAAYGYFNLIGKNFDNKRNKTQEKRSITLYDILDSTYNGYVTPDHTMLLNPEKLKGEFTPTQAKQFLDKYDLLIHQPNTDSGFSATVFQNKQTNEYVLSFSGTKPDDIGDIKSDKDLALGNIPKEQYFDMLLFYYQCIGKIPFYATSETKPKGQDTSFICDKLDIKCSHSVEYKLWEKLYQRSTESKYKPYIAESLLKDSSLPTTSNFTPPIDSTTKLTITGHSLGGCLAQLFALSFARYDTGDRGIIHEVYTYNSPGARKLKPLVSA